MILTTTKKRRRSRGSKMKETFLFLPIFHKGKFHWLSKVKLEKAFNGYKMTIIGIEKA